MDILIKQFDNIERYDKGIEITMLILKFFFLISTISFSFSSSVEMPARKSKFPSCYNNMFNSFHVLIQFNRSIKKIVKCLNSSYFRFVFRKFFGKIK